MRILRFCGGGVGDRDHERGRTFPRGWPPYERRVPEGQSTDLRVDHCQHSLGADSVLSRVGQNNHSFNSLAEVTMPTTLVLALVAIIQEAEAHSPIARSHGSRWLFYSS